MTTIVKRPVRRVKASGIMPFKPKQETLPNEVTEKEVQPISEPAPEEPVAITEEPKKKKRAKKNKKA